MARSTPAADMVLADDNFATIVAAIREGRGIFANISQFLRSLLSSIAGEALTMFLGVVLADALGLHDTGAALAVTLLATQILWVSLLTTCISTAAQRVSASPRHRRLGHLRRPGQRRALDGGATWLGTPASPRRVSAPPRMPQRGARRRTSALRASSAPKMSGGQISRSSHSGPERAPVWKICWSPGT
jgi:hypothetical protein